MKENAQNKVIDLLEVLKYARHFKPHYFTAGERILIHQERVSWLHVLDALDEGKKPDGPRYECPPKIQNKIENINNWLQLKRSAKLDL